MGRPQVEVDAVLANLQIGPALMAALGAAGLAGDVVFPAALKTMTREHGPAITAEFRRAIKCEAGGGPTWPVRLFWAHSSMNDDAPVPSVIANGQTVPLTLPCSLEQFLLQQGLLPRSVVVELNQAAVSPSEFAQRPLQAGDRLEIVRIVAGG